MKPSNPRFPASLAGLMLALLCAARVSAAGSPPAPPADASSPGNYVGVETCAQCHEEIVKSFARTPHWKITFDRRGEWPASPTPPSATGSAVSPLGNAKPAKRGDRAELLCESCHGPGGEHVQSGGDPAKIFAFKNRAPEEISRRCLSCHQVGEEHSNFLRSAHKVNQANCLDCHSPHHFTESPFILIKAQPGLCYGCHQEIRPEFSRPFHHRVDEKLVKCTDCHNQHGGFLASQAQLRTTAAGRDACLKCHADKAGPFVFEHAPLVTEGCTACHAPHGSSNPRLLVRSQVNTLCLECHTVTFGSAVRDTPGFHDQSAQYQACTLCHVAIHGSNFNQTFFR